MSTAQRVLVGYGTVILVVGFVLGSALGMLRRKTPAIRALATAHVETLMQSAMHLGSPSRSVWWASTLVGRCGEHGCSSSVPRCRQPASHSTGSPTQPINSPNARPV